MFFIVFVSIQWFVFMYPHGLMWSHREGAAIRLITRSTRETTLDDYLPRPIIYSTRLWIALFSFNCSHYSIAYILLIKSRDKTLSYFNISLSFSLCVLLCFYLLFCISLFSSAYLPISLYVHILFFTNTIYMKTILLGFLCLILELN